MNFTMSFFWSVWREQHNTTGAVRLSSKNANVWFCLSALIFCQICSTAAGNTYYVDYESGSNFNAGTTTSTAWKNCPGDSNATGIPATTKLSPGDVVKFKGGVVYSGGLVLSWSGSDVSQITYDGNARGDWGTGKAIIDCNFAVSSSTMKLNSQVSHIRIDGFELRNAGGYPDDDPVVRAAANGEYGNSTNAIRTPLPGWGLYLSEKNTNIYCANLYIHHIGIWHSTQGWDGRSVSGAGILMSSPDSVTVTNCEITKVGSQGIGLYAVTSARKILITDSYLHDDIPNWGMDIAPMGVGAILSDITVTRTKFIDLWSDWTGTPEDQTTGTASPHQNYIFIRTAGNLSTWTNVSVSACFFGETADTHTGYGGTGAIFLSQGPSVNIYNNIFSRNWSTTATIPVGYAVPPGMKQVVRIYNNTFLRGAGTTIISMGNKSSDARELYVENNIFINDRGLRANFTMFAATDSLNEPTVLDHNIYWSPDWSESQMYVANFGGGYLTLPQVKARGFEQAGQYRNPGLLDVFNSKPQLRNFEPASTSPARGAGRNFSKFFSDDFEGVHRPAPPAPWTIGAFHSTTTASIRPPTPSGFIVRPKT